MRSNRSGSKLWVLGLVAILLLSLPLAAGAQTTTTPTNGITNPKDGAVLSGTVEVQGYANSPSFLKWQLDLLPNADPNAGIFLAVGETAGEFTYSLDASKLPAGEHALRLRVVREDSNYDEYVTKFTIGSVTPSATTAAKPAAAATPAAKPAAVAATTPVTGTMGVSTNGLAAPREGQTVSGKVVVRGFASDPSFMKWQLDLLPNGDSNSPIFLDLGETAGVFTYTLDTTNYPAGEHALRLRVVRSDSNYNEYTTKFTIGQAAAGAAATPAPAATATPAPAATATPAPAATAAPAGETTNGITAPKEGATVSGSVAVTGYAAAPSFMKWQLDLLPNGDATQAAFLAFGTDPGQFTYTLDTTSLPAGEHALRLRVVRQDSNYDEYVTKFTIAK